MSHSKEEWRKILKARRAAIPILERTEAEAKIIDSFPFDTLNPETDVIAGYWPIQSEFEIRPLMKRLQHKGFMCALPICIESKLRFLEWGSNTPLIPHAFGTLAPDQKRATVCTPSIILCPLLGFDSKGSRLGYGGGFFDRTLADLRKTQDVKLIGFGFAVQEVARLPREEHDINLDGVVNENGFRLF